MEKTVMNEKTGKLGFGYMRLPRNDGVFDMEQVNKMADAFIESGGSYFDAAYVYDGAEVALRESVVKRYPRDQVLLASKFPMSMIKPGDDHDMYFNTTLERLGTNYIDFYLLHGLSARQSKKAEDLGVWDYVAGLKKKGQIRHMGFSFHGPAAELDEILTAHPEAEFVQLQINYLDWDNPKIQSRLVYETARKHNKPIIVMEPVKGGKLASPNSPVLGLLHEAAPGVSLANWAFRFVAQLEGVFVTLSGMSSLGQMTENIATFKDINPLSHDETAVLAKAVEIFNSVPRIACTECRYCVNGCPSKIMIPGVINIYNEFLIHNSSTNLAHSYRFVTHNGGKAGDCVKCRACEEICPQGLEIVDTMEKTAELLG